MRKKAYMVSLFLGFCFLLPGAAAFADQTGEEAAILASEAWLALAGTSLRIKAGGGLPA